MLNNSDFKGMDVEALKKMSEEASRMINAEMGIFEKTYEDLKKKLPEGQVGKLELAKASFNKAIILAKEGKQEEATNIINTIKNGH